MNDTISLSPESYFHLENGYTNYPYTSPLWGLNVEWLAPGRHSLQVFQKNKKAPNLTTNQAPTPQISYILPAPFLIVTNLAKLPSNIRTLSSPPDCATVFHQLNPYTRAMSETV